MHVILPFYVLVGFVILNSYTSCKVTCETSFRFTFFANCDVGSHFHTYVKASYLLSAPVSCRFNQKTI